VTRITVYTTPGTDAGGDTHMRAYFRHGVSMRSAGPVQAAAELLLARVLNLGGAAWLLWTLLRTLLDIRRDALSGPVSHEEPKKARIRFKRESESGAA
jgi:hypothetical protein